MKNKVKNFLQFTLLAFTFLLCFLQPAVCMRAASKGLLQWYQNILPVLFPFMILTSLMHTLQYDLWLSQTCHWLKRLFGKYPKEASYIILFGFLCGFPMGAKLVRDAYLEHRLSHKEASFLLCFCNNLSPAFFIGIVLPILSGLQPIGNCYPIEKIPYMICMYGIPLLYGVFLQSFLTKQSSVEPTVSLRASLQPASLAEALDSALTDNIMPILKLGCYLMIFQIYSTFLIIILQKYIVASSFLKAIVCSLLEIVNGSLQFGQNQIQGVLPAATFFFLLHLGGASCLLQTNIFLQGTGLKLTNYLFHKAIIGLLSGICFVLFQFIG